MKAKRLILALTATTLLASCGKGKEIEQDEAATVASNIAKKVNDSSFEAPAKFSATIAMEIRDDDDNTKGSVQINYSKTDYYVSVVGNSGDDKVGLYAYYEKSEGKFYVVSDMTEDKERSFFYSAKAVSEDQVESYFNNYAEDIGAETSSVDISNIASYGASLAVAATASTASAAISIPGYSVDLDYHYYSAGEGYLVVEGNTKYTQGEEVSTSKATLTIENYLLTKYTSELSSSSSYIKTEMSFRYGSASLSKPNLKDAVSTDY